MTFCGDLPFVPSGIHHPFLRTFAARGITATTGNDCPGQTAKVFACFWAKSFAGCTFTPGLAETVVAVSAPGDRGLTGEWHRTEQRAGTRRNDVKRVCETALPLTSRRPFAGMPGARPRRDRGGATGTVAASPGFPSGMEARQGGDSFAGSVHDSRPARGTPGKGISRRTTKQAVSEQQKKEEQ